MSIRRSLSALIKYIPFLKKDDEVKIYDSDMVIGNMVMNRKNIIHERRYIRSEQKREIYSLGGEDIPCNPFHTIFARHYNINNDFEVHDLYARILFPDFCTQPAVVPVETYNNDFHCVQQRIIEPREQQTARFVGGRTGVRMRQARKLFIEYLRQRIEPLTPLSNEEVIEQMPKRARARGIEANLDENDAQVGIKIIECFQKKETYSTPSPPRNISAVDDGHLLRASRFTMAISKAFHECDDMPWYCPGANPKTISARMAECTLNGREDLFGADYSKFDGHQNPQMRRWVAEVASSLFLDPRDQKDCHDTIMDEIDATGRTRFGIKYSLDGSMASGSAWTTIGNTLLNALVYFASCLDNSRPLMLSNEAIAHFHRCLIYGDDSIGPLHVKKAFTRICEDIGLKVTFEDFSHGVTFLGRLYFKDGYGDSMMEPTRVYPKLNITCAPLATTTKQAAANRFHGYLSACEHEPWIAEICRAALRAYGSPEADYRTMTNDEIIMFERKGYYIDEDNMQEAWLVAACRLGMPVSDLQQVIHCYKNCKTLAQFPTGWWRNGRIINSKVKNEDGSLARIWMNDSANSYCFSTLEIPNADDYDFIRGMDPCLSPPLPLINEHEADQMMKNKNLYGSPCCGVYG